MSEPVGKWLVALECPSRSGKTSVWRLTPIDATRPVGFIGWYGKWRRYALQPEPGTVFEQDCLRAIADFCEARTRAHNAARLRKKPEYFRAAAANLRSAVTQAEMPMLFDPPLPTVASG